jgi:inorganic pyrophosphatase
LKIENEVLKNEILDLKNLNSTYLAEAESYKLKYKELKNSNSAEKSKGKNLLN